MLASRPGAAAPSVGQYPPCVGISRRAVIFGSALLGAAGGVGGWALLANARVVPGRDAVDSALGRCDIVSNPPEAEPGIVVRASFFSAHRRRSVGYTLAYPPKAVAGARLPVCLVLHGLGGDERHPFDSLGYHRILAGSVAGGVPPFVLAAVNGGDAYWHPRANGDDPLGMLLEDFPVVLTQHGLPTETFGILGYSMGGFGALTAATEAPKRFPVVVAIAPALWDSFDDAHDHNAGSFDSAEDWHAWGDMRRRLDKLKGLKVRVDCGDSDVFAPAVADLTKAFPDPAGVHIGKGCHDNAYWRSVAPAQFELIGNTLTPKKV
jgi:S-formylglutathione hydrolase FrmB